jgi:RHS repeat-associated protein
MLSEVQRPDGIRVKYSYDPFARRTAKRTIAANGRPAHQVQFVWDGHAVIHELGSTHELVTWYWEPETLTPVAKEQGGRRWTIAADDFGTPTEMYDESGRLTWKMRLDVFGTATFDAGRAAECPWRWSGQYADSEDSLVYNRFRYYDPQRGSFVSADPVGLLGGTNLFAYVPDPTSTSDPFGLGATIDDRGFFAPSNEYGRGTSPKGRVRIPYQGTRDRDFTLANKQAKFKETPKGYTWHHANYNSRTGYGDMQLVRKTAHKTGHSGGVSEFKAATGIDYDGAAAVKHVENEGRLRGKPCP